LIPGESDPLTEKRSKTIERQESEGGDEKRTTKRERSLGKRRRGKRKKKVLGSSQDVQQRPHERCRVRSIGRNQRAEIWLRSRVVGDEEGQEREGEEAKSLCGRRKVDTSVDDLP